LKISLRFPDILPTKLSLNGSIFSKATVHKIDFAAVEVSSHLLCAVQAGAKVVLDFASWDLVDQNAEKLDRLVAKGVFAVCCNEDEALAFHHAMGENLKAKRSALNSSCALQQRIHAHECESSGLMEQSGNTQEHKADNSCTTDRENEEVNRPSLDSALQSEDVIASVQTHLLR
jgi:hypothetical protein